MAEPQDSYHVTVVGLLDDALRAVLPAGWSVRVQGPVALDDESAPEPDLAVVRGPRAEYRYAHPAHPALVVEVAESSLDFDRREKGSLYRDPSPDGAAPYGWRYGSAETIAPPAAVRGLELPATSIAVGAFLP